MSKLLITGIVTGAVLGAGIALGSVYFSIIIIRMTMGII